MGMSLGNIRMKCTVRVVAAICLVALSGGVRFARAQPVPPIGEADQNKKLRIQIDRSTIRAFEPVYLCLTAEQFATVADAEVYLQHGNGPWAPIAIPKKDWTKSQVSNVGRIPVQRRGTILQALETNGVRTWLFNAAGEYKLRVKIGPDSTTLSLTVTAPEVGEEESWTSLGDRITDVLENNFSDPPEQATIDTCARVIRKYPKTLCAAYCQSYISITKFKMNFEKNRQGGGKAVYGDVADELQKIATAFRESFFGEMTGFYAAYARGLTGEFQGTLAIAEAMKTRVTPWGDAVVDMRTEILAHLAPIMLDPTKQAPTTGPATAPAVAPVKP
jgi:hypothetical protein